MLSLKRHGNVSQHRGKDWPLSMGSEGRLHGELLIPEHSECRDLGRIVRCVALASHDWIDGRRQDLRPVL